MLTKCDESLHQSTAKEAERRGELEKYYDVE